MKILLVKLSSIGDIVHALPALSRIRHALPEAEISWAVDSRYSEILGGNPYLTELIEIDGKRGRRRSPEDALVSLGSQITGIRKREFDVVLDMQGLLKSAGIARLGGAGVVWGFDKNSLRESAARFLYSKTVEIPPRTHVIKKNIMLAEGALGIGAGDSPLEFPIATTEAHRKEASAIAELAGGDFAILNPAGGWVTKLWPAERFGELADVLWERLGLRSIISIGPGDEALGELAMQHSKSGKATIASPSLKGFYELAKRAAIYVGGDTGPTHIAIAAGAPIVGIFGPTEWWRNGSLNPHDICVERNDIGCRVDCHRRTCSNWICMEISVETVFEAVKTRLLTARTAAVV